MYPEDSYLTKLGKAIYAMNYLEWIIIEVILLLKSSKSIDQLAGMDGGQLNNELHKVISGNIDYKERAMPLAEQHLEIIRKRNDIAHARPATTLKNRQQLYRWAPTKTTRAQFITEEELEAFTISAEELDRKFDHLRQKIKNKSNV